MTGAEKPGTPGDLVDSFLQEKAIAEQGGHLIHGSVGLLAAEGSCARCGAPLLLAASAGSVSILKKPPPTCPGERAGG